ncbi:MAG TPA: hypothetical protein VMS79_00470 [Methanomassiliicoccales archaeon]|nr:hypothetical protein [Methanomassiliicoccales archaeon]
MVGAAADPDVPPISDVAHDIAKEIEATRQRITDLREEKSDPWPLLGFLAVIVIIEIIALGSSFIMLWVIGSFFLYCYAFLLLFFPTSRGRQKMDSSQKSQLKQDAIKIAKKRRVITGLSFFRAFLYNTAAQSMAFVVIFSISMFVSAVSLLTGNTDIISTAGILASSLLIMSFYAWIMRYRPYSPEYSGKLRQEGLRLVDISMSSESLRVIPVALGTFAILAGGLVTALLIPGLTLSKFVDFWQFSLGANIWTYLLTIVIEYFIVRSVQSIESKRMAIAFLGKKTELLQETLTGGFSDEKKRVRLATLQIFRISRHDLFGYIPVYNVDPNLPGIAAAEEIDNEMLERQF